MSPGHDPLDAFVTAGVLHPDEARLAHRLARIGGDGRSEVLLATALALRAPRAGHVCVELDNVALHIAADPRAAGAGVHDGQAAAEVAGLPWPDPDAWHQLLGDSPAVRRGGPGSTPLVLEHRRIYLDRYWTYEQQLAASLDRRVRQESDPIDIVAARGWLDTLFPASDGLDRQRLAAAVALQRRLTVIAGGPGTGKTYTVTRVLAALHLAAAARDDRRALRVALAAPTGKAAARLTGSLRTGLPGLPVDAALRETMAHTRASTIHHLLGVRRGASTRFRHDASTPLPHDVVIVDEASMVSLPLMAKLVDAVRDDARLILLGDRDQLASVEAGAVLGDICGPDGSRPVLRLSPTAIEALEPLVSGRLAHACEPADAIGIWDSIVRLDRFRRFDEHGPLAAVAARIQQGTEHIDDVLGLLDDQADRPTSDHGAASPDAAGIVPGAVLVDPAVDADARSRVLSVAVHGWTDAVAAAGAGAPAHEVLAAMDRLRVLCALRRGPAGVTGWNRAIEQALAQAHPGFDPDERWYVGRPVLITRNDRALRLSNGDVGMILADPDRPGRRVAAFWADDGTVRTISPARLPTAETCFAMTIHKSQGSQFDHAVVVLPDEPSPLLTRELLYTAITRAAHRVTLLGRRTIVRDALSRPIQRASGLQQRLWSTT